MVEITSSVTRIRRVTAQRPALAGLVLGGLGVVLFSGTFPATKFALRDLSPWFISFGRAAVAAALAGITLALLRSSRPHGGDVWRLMFSALSVVIATPLLIALSLQKTPASHVAVVFAVLPAVTAAFGVLRGGERPGALFWGAALAGVAIVAAFEVSQSHGGLSLADGYVLLSVVVCAAGYTEGALVARSIGGLETICWSLVAMLPLTLPGALLTAPHHAPSTDALLGFLYVSIFAMFLGFVFWYAGLARGIARVSQTQLMQPLLTLALSAVLLGEHIGWVTALAAVGVVTCVALTQVARVASTAARTSRRRRPTRAAAIHASAGPGPPEGSTRA
jgi:drug/metabolite transporter (DMT)-like permease